jgi:pilus assembly protein Flp/PilA
MRTIDFSNHLRSVYDIRTLTAFFADRSAVTSIEYAVVASMIAVAILAGVSNLGSAVKSNYTSVSTALK